ncbi:MAG: toll/interleukin-1 receptor domain-containing protein [Terriglobales bacterium]
MSTRRRHIAFWSYIRFDDKHDEQWLSGLKQALEAEIQALSGIRVEIFQDVEGIAWGEQWKSKIRTSEDDAVFLIPIITPSYFKSDACRSELEQFVEREKTMGFGGLILPLYYITCSELEDKFAKGADWLAQLVADHNYRDIRSLRHRKLDSYEARQEVKSLAAELIEQLKSFAQWHLSSKKMEAQITAPASRTHVPRKALILGTLHGVSEWIEIWLVVVAEGGTHYHPQAHLSRSENAWRADVYIGRSKEGADANQEFSVHVLAVTEDVSNAFQRYRKDAGKRNEWRGVPKPPDSRVLATLKVVRDDSTSAFGFIVGVYDEHGPDGAPLGGMIRVKLTGPDSLATEAQNQAGKTEWTGSIKMEIFSDPIRGVGNYNYLGKADSGEHSVMVDAATGDLKISGKNLSHPGGKSFQTVWKRRK